MQRGKKGKIFEAKVPSQTAEKNMTRTIFRSQPPTGEEKENRKKGGKGTSEGEDVWEEDNQ